MKRNQRYCGGLRGDTTARDKRLRATLVLVSAKTARCHPHPPPEKPKDQVAFVKPCSPTNISLSAEHSLQNIVVPRYRSMLERSVGPKEGEMPPLPPLPLGHVDM